MLGKVAVIIAGEYRTWDHASRYIFNFVENISDSVDYYFVSWTTTSDYWKNLSVRQETIKTVDAEMLVNSFAGKNLVDYLLEPAKIEYEDVYYLRAHLSKLGNILKRRHELKTNLVYDQVIEIRPDIFLPAVKNNIKPCKDFEYVIGDIYTHYQDLPSISDLYFRTSSIGNDLLATRNKFNKFNTIKKFKNLLVREVDYEPMPSSRDSHYLLLDFIMSKRMIPLKDQSEAETATVIRPNFPDNLDKLPIEEIRDLYHQYQKRVDNI